MFFFFFFQLFFTIWENIKEMSVIENIDILESIIKL